MSKISLQPNASGAGTFSIVSPDSNINRTLNLPDEDGSLLSNNGAITVDSSGNVGIGTSSPSATLDVDGTINFPSESISRSFVQGQMYRLLNSVTITDSSSIVVSQPNNDGTGVLQVTQLTERSDKTDLPFFTNGGGGVAWRFTILDPNSGWRINNAGFSFSWSSGGSGGNTYTVSISSGLGTIVFERTGGSGEYRVDTYVLDRLSDLDRD